MIKEMLTKTYYIGICDYCGREFKGHFRYKDDGSYREQKYCSIKCMAAGKVIISPDKYIAHLVGKKNDTRLEHDIIAEQILNRPLNSQEVVHHIDGNKSNNEPSNLRVYHSNADHAKHHNSNPLSVIEKQLEDGSYIVKDAIQVVDIFTPETTGYCAYCGKKFMKYKSTLKYCSPKCRMKYNNDRRIEKYGHGYSHRHVGKNAYLNNIQSSTPSEMIS